LAGAGGTDLTALALLLTGFSIFSAMSLALTHFRAAHYENQTQSRVMGLALLLALASLQIAHFAWLYLGWPWISTTVYRALLFVVAPAFFLFSRPLLHPPIRSEFSPVRMLHFCPAAVAPFISGTLALPLAFGIGIGYLLWLARSLHALRRERANFQFEMILLGIAFIIAAGISAIGLLQAAVPEKLFFCLYASSIGAAFLLVQTALNRRPQLSAEISETTRAIYANSTLTHIDCDAALQKLDALMRVDRIFTDEALSLPKLAERLGLTTHQLSELINSRLGKGFARYLREQRIGAAKAMLCDEPTASVLSVGLNAGFSSQSSFYEAFREIEGMTPGQYRKLHAGGAPRNARAPVNASQISTQIPVRAELVEACPELVEDASRGASTSSA
jgi:AraC-like DNA-binding protein